MRVRRTSDTPTNSEPPGRVSYSGFTEPVADLYEFRTSAGQYIYLHEMECVSLQFAPMERRLELVFECADSDVMDHPSTLTLTFSEAVVRQWADDATGDPALTSASELPRARGQVTDLARVGEAGFSLRLLDIWVEFEARSVACEARPGLASPEAPTC